MDTIKLRTNFHQRTQTFRFEYYFNQFKEFDQQIYQIVQKYCHFYTNEQSTMQIEDRQSLTYIYLNI